MRLRSIITLLCLALVIVAIILRVYMGTTAQNRSQIQVFAASSLTNVFDELRDQFMAMHPDTEIIVNYASSSTLSTQILEGAPADLFASADLIQLEDLNTSGLITPDSIQIFAETELIIIVPASNTTIQSVGDIATAGVSLILANQGVPIRHYSDALLLNLAMLYGDEFPQAVLTNLVSEESNVRQIVARIVLDEADVGIVYSTDVTPDIADKVRIITLPPQMSPRVQYPIAIITTTSQPDLAQDFMAFLQSDQGQSILQSWGFLLPNNDA